MSNFVFNGEEVRFDLNQKPVKNLNDKVPDWFINWLVQKQKEILTTYYVRNTVFQCDFPPDIFYPDPLNPGAYVKPGNRGIPITVSLTIGANDGGDGQLHEIIYYERIFNDKNSKDSKNGKRYTMNNGGNRINFDSRLYVPKEKINLAVFMKYISPKQGIDYVVIDEGLATEAKTALRRRYNNIRNMIEDGIEERRLRIIAHGEYRIVNADQKDIDSIRDELITKIESAWLTSRHKAETEFTKFESTVRDFGNVAENKAFVGKCIDRKAAIVLYNPHSNHVCLNQGGENNLEHGTKLFKLREDQNVHDALYEHLYELGNPQDVVALKAYLKKQEEFDGDIKEQEQIFRDYQNLFQGPVPVNKQKDKIWIQNKINEEIERLDTIRRASLETIDEVVEDEFDFEKEEEVEDEPVDLTGLDGRDIEELRELYVKVLGKNLPPPFKNKKDWIVNKLREYEDMLEQK